MSETLSKVVPLIHPDFLVHKLQAAKPLEFIQFQATVEQRLLDFDGKLRFFPPGFQYGEITPDPVTHPMEHGARQLRNELHDYVRPPPSKVAQTALSARINARNVYDNLPAADQALIVPPPRDYSNTDVLLLATLQTSVQFETNEAKEQVNELGALLAWIRERCSPELTINLDLLNQSDRPAQPFTKNKIYRSTTIYLEGVCRGQNTSFRDLILTQLAGVGLALSFQEALMVIDQINYWYKLLIAFDLSHPSDEHPPTCRTLVNMFMHRFPDVDPMKRLRKHLIKMLDDATYVYVWDNILVKLRLEICRTHAQGPTNAQTALAAMSANSPLGHGQSFYGHNSSQGLGQGYSTNSSASSVPFIRNQEVANLQMQLQDAHMLLGQAKSHGFSYGTIADSPVVPTPQVNSTYTFPGNPNWGINPPAANLPVGSCHSYPFYKFGSGCKFSHLIDGQLDPQMEMIQTMSNTEIRLLNPPLDRSEQFRPRASQVLIDVYNRLMSAMPAGKRQCLR